MKKALIALFAALTCTASQAQTICANPVYDAPVHVWAMIGTGSNLVVGGSSNTSSAFQVASYDGSTWTTLPGDFNDYIRALAQTPAGIVAAGNFTEISGVPVNRIARFEGGAWVPLGLGIDSVGDVLAVEEHGGELFCAGTFTSAGGAPAQNIAKWDGVQWSNLGAGIDGTVRALASHGGALVAGGDFALADGLALTNVAAWDGATFFAPGTGALPPVYDFERVGASLFAAAQDIFRLSAGSWSGVGSLGLDTDIQAKALTIVNGEPVALGNWVTFCLTFGDDPCVAAARYSGGAWVTFVTDDQGPTPWNLHAANFGGSVYLNGVGLPWTNNLFTEYTSHAVLGSLQPEVANWYDATTLTLNVGCLDTNSPGTITIGNSGPIPATVTSPTTLTANIPALAIPNHGLNDVVFEQNGDESTIPWGFKVLPSLTIQHNQLFTQSIEFTVESGSGAGTAWFFAGVTTPPQPFPVPGIHGLVEMPLGQLFQLGSGSIAASPAVTVHYNANMVPKGIPIRFQALVAEDVAGTTLWSITNSQSILFPIFF